MVLLWGLCSSFPSVHKKQVLPSRPFLHCADDTQRRRSACEAELWLALMWLPVSCWLCFSLPENPQQSCVNSWHISCYRPLFMWWIIHFRDYVDGGRGTKAGVRDGAHLFFMVAVFNLIDVCPLKWFVRQFSTHLSGINRDKLFPSSWNQFKPDRRPG